jgi:hypothetical protein
MVEQQNRASEQSVKELWGKIGRVLAGDFEKNAFFRALALGTVFSLLITLMLGAIQGVLKITSSFPYFEVTHQENWIGIVFVSFSLLFAIVGYLSAINVRDDLLTPLRKKLVGYWQVSNQSWMLHPQKIEYDWAKSYSTIGIEPVSGKLLIHFEISDSDIFKDQAFNVTATTFSLDAASRKLIYFYETTLELKHPIGNPPDQITSVHFPFLGVLKMITEDDGRINEMTGHWYDINNSIYNLARRMQSLDGFEKLSEAVEQGAVTFGGELRFRRIKSLPGMDKDQVAP